MDLQFIWYVLIAVLITGYAVLDGFDLGIGVLSPFMARSDAERSVLRTIVGPVWDGNEVWLLTGGGALFAAFPAVYAATFSGFYLAIMLVLFGLIFRALSLEFRHADPGWGRFWDAGFFVGSLLPALLFGVAAGNVIRGVPLNATGDYSGTFWGLLNPFALVVGLTGLVMFVTHGACWTALKTDGPLHRRAVRVRSVAQWLFVLLVALTTLVTALTLNQRFTAVLHRPVGWVMIVVLIAGLAGTRLAIVRARDLQAFVGQALAIAALVGLAAVGNYPYLLPARGSAPDTALTVANSASANPTLRAMLIIAAIGVPIVLAYTVLIYRTFRGRTKAGAGEY